MPWYMYAAIGVVIGEIIDSIFIYMRSKNSAREYMAWRHSGDAVLKRKQNKK